MKFAGLGNGYQTFIGKGEQNFAGDSNSADSCLYFQSPDPGATGGNSVFSIRTQQANGILVIVNGTTPFVINQRHNVATTLDGATLKL